MSEDIQREFGAVDGQHRLAALWTLFLSLDSVLASEGAACAAASSGPTGDRPSGRSPGRGPDTTTGISQAEPAPGSGDAEVAGTAPDPASSGQVSPHRRAARELVDLLGRMAPRPRTLSTGADERRVAELLEVLDMDDEARVWWLRAADLGDQDAIDYLEILHENQEPPTGSSTALLESPREYSSFEKKLLLLLTENECACQRIVSNVPPVREKVASGEEFQPQQNDNGQLFASPFRHFIGCDQSECQADADVHHSQSVQELAEQLVREIEVHLASPETLTGGVSRDRRSGPGTA